MKPTSCTFPLPEQWAEPEAMEDVVVADDVLIHRAGIAIVASDGSEICGSAAGPEATARDRAWFELFERMSAHDASRGSKLAYPLLDAEGTELAVLPANAVFPESDAPANWRYARSNGIAIHVDWQTACLRAKWELAERDRILRAWAGETTPVRLDDGVIPNVVKGAASYAWRAYSFPESPSTTFSSGLEVVGIFGFPTRGELPFVLGFAARPELVAATDAAADEALQMLAFLWGEPREPREPREPLETEAVASAPTPGQHLDRYQLPGAEALVLRWLEEGHARFFGGSDTSRPSVGALGFVDLTPPWLGVTLRVAKAVCPQAVPLAFGDAPYMAHLPAELRLHPIP